MSIKKWALMGAAALLLAGCSSVSLDNAPVDDRSSGAAAAKPAESTVAPATVGTVGDGKADQSAIANVARVIYFDFDSYVIKPEFQAVIDAHARYLKADRKRKVVLEGHADERGGREYNLALGQRRAEAVRRALGLLGVADSQMEAVSFGKEKPAVQGHNEEAWAKNRRVEFNYR
jgi:peptidoglycan-associated lipoprotein